RADLDRHVEVHEVVARVDESARGDHALELVEEVLFVDLAVGDGVLKERGQRERARSRRRRLGRGRRRARAEPEPTEEGELRDELVAEFLRVLAVARDHAFEAGFERALLLRDRRFALRELLLDRREALDPRLVLARERLLLLGLL